MPDNRGVDREASLDHMKCLALACQIAAGYVSNHQLAKNKIPDLLGDIYRSIAELADQRPDRAVRTKPAVPVNQSVKRDHIVCLEDGKKLSMLKRYLRSHFDMSPEEYRARWNLPPDYPMVAPSYSKHRSKIAKEIGLGKAASTRKHSPARNSGGKPARVSNKQSHASGS